MLPIHCTPSHLLTQSWYKQNISVCQERKEFSSKWFWRGRNGNWKKFQAFTLPSTFPCSVYSRQGWMKEGQVVTEYKVHNEVPQLWAWKSALSEHKNYHWWEELNSSSHNGKVRMQFYFRKWQRPITHSVLRRNEGKTSQENPGEMSSESTSCLYLDDVAFGLLEWHLGKKDVQKLKWRILFSQSNS